MTPRRPACAIEHAIDTHVHADQYSGGPSIGAAGRRAVWLHESDKGRVSFDFTPSATDSGSRRQRAGGCGPDTWASLDSVCLFVRNLRRGGALVRHDRGHLFVGAVGHRTRAATSAKWPAAVRTLQAKLLSLPRNWKSTGPSGDSACGASLSGKPASTIGSMPWSQPSAWHRTRGLDSTIARVSTDAIRRLYRLKEEVHGVNSAASDGPFRPKALAVTRPQWSRVGRPSRAGLEMPAVIIHRG